jgi:hypothetical protein
VDVCRAEIPSVLELRPEERRREGQPAAERLADAEDVREVEARPQLADPPHARVDRVDYEQRAGFVAPLAQPLEKARWRHPRAAPALYRLHDHAARAARQLPGILAVSAAEDRTGQPAPKREAELLEPRCGERKQARAVVGAVERHDARLPRREQRRAQRDLDRVLTGDAEARGPRQPLAQADDDLRLGEIPQRVHHLLLGPGREDLRIPVAERCDAEARREVEVLAAVGVDDPATLRRPPDQAEPLRRSGSRRLSVSAAMYPAIFGFSWRRRIE